MTSEMSWIHFYKFFDHMQLKVVSRQFGSTFNKNLDEFPKISFGTSIEKPVR